MNSLATPSRAQRFVLDSVPWKGYLHQLRAYKGRHVRVTYDRGRLEIMTTSPRHERNKKLLGMLVEALLEELGREWACYGSMTFKKRQARKGFEPDECYWIQNEPQVRGKDDLKIKTDPPPDLALEIEITRSAVNRLGIHAAWGVAEVWRYDGKTLRFAWLTPQGTYEEQPTSRAFPFLRTAELERFLDMRTIKGNAALLREFREWVRQRVQSAWSSG